ncbi:hypothetical protein L8P27_05105 [Enterobacter asburiae]|uniref:hypothetical protein n=1 Tax=Enterobacter asburiae TaxID=61645 RepID=UPI002005BB7C|nr:hypothetical protein [Enterobacter asburiae]MCK7227230.1 hypothetical protein [Enterobacter asburiae]
MITSQVKKVLLEAMFMGLQHDLQEESKKILAVLHLIMQDKDDIALCLVLFLIRSRDIENAKRIAGGLPEIYQQQLASLFTLPLS